MDIHGRFVYRLIADQRRYEGDMKIRTKTMSILLAAGLLFAVQAPANAASKKDLVNSSTEKTTTRVSQECLAALDKAKAAGQSVKGVDCTLTTTSTTSAAKSVTAADILADTTLRSTDRTELLAAALAGAVYSKHFSWFTTGGAYTVTHNGTFYYNGSKAWATTSYGGYQGSHFCFTNYAAGVSISIQQCYEVGTTFERDFYFQWQVTWPWGPPYFGLSYSVSHWGSVYGNGTTS